MRNKIAKLKMFVISTLFVFGLVFVSGTNVSAQEPTPVLRTTFGSVGIARGEVARLNVTNLKRGDFTDDNREHNPPGIPCVIGYQFLDARGNTLARGVETVFPGNTNSFELSFREALPRGGFLQRVQIRANVWSLMTDEDTRRCAMISTLEIYDSLTGSTKTLYPESPR
jgi:hypothetical protein